MVMANDTATATASTSAKQSDANTTGLLLIEYLAAQAQAIRSTVEPLPLPYDDDKRDRYWLDCTNRILNAPPTNTANGLYCNRTRDVFGCWPDTAAGQVATISCPDYVVNFHPDWTVSRLCTMNGTWVPFKKSLYKPCIDTEGTYRAIITYYVGYSLSIVACTIAFMIFAAFRSLRCPRVTIHQNLFMTYIWTGVFWIVYYALQGGPPRHDQLYAGACKTVHVLATYLTLCSYCWMFCEGLYLYMNLVFAFINPNKVLKACVFIGWVTPVPFVIAYTVGMTHSETAGTCWDNPSSVIWFTQGLACLTLVLNLFFVSHIVYILITKMRDVRTSEQQQIRKVAKAILVLVPLLGLQYLLTPIAPDTKHTFYSLYVILSALIAATQGFFVAVVFCFVNGDVTKTIQRKMAAHRYLSRLVRHRKSSADMTNVSRYSTVRQSIDVRLMSPSPASKDDTPAIKGAKPLADVTNGCKRTGDKPASNAFGPAEENGDGTVTQALLNKDLP